MIRKSLYIGAMALMAALMAACNDSQSDLLTPKLYFENNVINVSAEDDTYLCDVTSRVSTPVGKTVNVSYQAGGQSLVDKYNARYGTSAELFPEENYKFLNTTAQVAPGDVYADACQIEFTNMSQVQEGSTYVLPLVMTTTDIDMIPDNNVAYIVIKKPVRIYKAMEFGTAWLDIRLPTSFKTTGSVTYEALVYATSWKNLGTIIGREGTLIMRTGDLNHPDNELQMAGDIAIQMPDVNVWETGKWYHVAFTYDAASGQANLYLNGEVIANKDAGAGKTFDISSDFGIGYAYDYDSSRKWKGYMSEVRLWTVARSANQIKENMLLVDPAADGLAGYWKLNGTDYEQRDGTWYVLDQTANHNDATCNRGLRSNNVVYCEPTMVDVDVRI